jgi:hypothetical protein
MGITTGAQIRAARALLGWSRRRLAQAAGLHENSVKYWEDQQTISDHVYTTPVACRLMRQALQDAGVVTFSAPAPGVRLCRKSPINRAVRAQARARVMGSYRRVKEDALVTKRYDPNENSIDAHHRGPPAMCNGPVTECGDRTRSGGACRRRGTGRGGRYINHGGASTGPKTAAGRQRIADSQRRRWSNGRKEQE